MIYTKRSLTRSLMAIQGGRTAELSHVNRLLGLGLVAVSGGRVSVTVAGAERVRLYIDRSIRPIRDFSRWVELYSSYSEAN